MGEFRSKEIFSQADLKSVYGFVGRENPRTVKSLATPAAISSNGHHV
jgi:hypothetical protein